MGDAMLFTISLGITLLGLVVSYGVAKRRGAASGLRGAAWSMVPLAATLTGVTGFVADLVFSPAKWAGVALAGLAVLLYLVSGVMLSRRGDGDGGGRPQVGGAGTAGRAGRKERGERRPQRAVEPSAGPSADPDLAEIEEILRRRGIQ
ncbi:hypothetical protein SAMN04489712_108199 [Thermomonospora echinospora]|uniref:Uncharacterized protein n=1 Tax=Thermomonospora echinospora TaxID=1992 RepID=A0A1H6C0L1_9ACTN|nr:hypothetical protein [Thermomonospora echinospora]SEG66509.1 hypothetical protein SAMN04489712_108199 [Thermomonospora echinospora]